MLSYRMVSFREHIVWLRDDGNNEFPERFNCEIYYSKQLAPVDQVVKYNSNFSIKHIFSGGEKYIVNGKYRKIGENQTLIVNDRSEVTNINASGNAFSIFISPSVLMQCYHGLITSPDTQLEYPLNDEHHELNFFDEVISHEAKVLEYLKLKLEINPDLLLTIDFYYEMAEKLILWQNNIYKKIDKIERKGFPTRKEVFMRTNKAHAFIMDNLNNGFDLDELSREAGMSKFQLIRTFKDSFGSTPHRFFLLKRIELAKNQILTFPNKSISQIALSLGFADIYSFSKQFKQILGFSPSVLRQERTN